MSEIEEKKVTISEIVNDDGHQDGDTDSYLSEREKELKELEQRLNTRIDAELISNPARMPKAVWFIIPNEFCERFCYYGVTPLMFKYYQLWNGLAADQAKIYTHIFKFITYFCPLFGAALSDSYLGKFWTITSLSTVYLSGMILITAFAKNGLIGEMGSVPLWATLFPLMLISIGTGGIKPCVSTHGGDQFLPSQQNGMDYFFSIFYVAINLGALISGYLTPAIKDGVQCYGAPCYFLAYFICAALFAIALCVFIFGHRYYRIVPPVGQFLPFRSVALTVIAFKNWVVATPSDRKNKPGFLNYAEDYDASFVEETRLLGRVFGMILPTMLFWMVYDQGSTEWQAQYDLMDKSIFGLFSIPTESFGNINAVLVILMVPFMAYFVYPMLERRDIRFTILQRMGLGFFFMVLAFLVSGILQGIVLANVGHVSVLWTLPQWFLLSLGETMLSPEGLKFTYTNVGKKLRAQSASFWLLMTSFGNLIVTAIEEAISGSNTPLQSSDGSISYPSKYYMYTAIALFGNLWFVLWARYVFQYKDEDGSFTHVPPKGGKAFPAPAVTIVPSTPPPTLALNVEVNQAT